MEQLEIKKQAEEFYKKWLPKAEYIECDICGAKNCVHNDKCISCYSNFNK